MTNPYMRDSDSDPAAKPCYPRCGIHRRVPQIANQRSRRDAEERPSSHYIVFGMVCGTAARLAEPHEALPDLDPAEGRFITLLSIPVAPGRSKLPARALI